jgi:FkbM family methyltransferase
MHAYLKDCRWGRFMLLRGDMISEYVNLLGEWCEAEVQLFQRLLNPSSSVVEVGANIGMHAVPLCRIAPQGMIYCYEPQRIISQILCGNIALNSLTNAHVRPCAVGAEAGVIPIPSAAYDHPWNYGAFSLEAGFNTEGVFPADTSTEIVDVVSLDAEQKKFDFRNIDLLKIDAEGFELNVLAGADALIGKHRPYIFLESNRAEQFDALHATIRGLGYQCYWFLSRRWRPDNYNHARWPVEGHDVNMICAPSTRPAPQGLASVRSFDDLSTRRIPLL